VRRRDAPQCAAGALAAAATDASRLAAPIFAHVAPSPQRLSAMGGGMGVFQGLGGGFRSGGSGGLTMQPSPAPRASMQRGYGM